MIFVIIVDTIKDIEMRAYGSQGHWDLEEYGVPTRIGKKRSATRKYLRRKLHQKAKTDLRKELYREQLEKF